MARPLLMAQQNTAAGERTAHAATVRLEMAKSHAAIRGRMAHRAVTALAPSVAIIPMAHHVRRVRVRTRPIPLVHLTRNRLAIVALRPMRRLHPLTRPREALSLAPGPASLVPANTGPGCFFIVRLARF